MQSDLWPQTAMASCANLTQLPTIGVTCFLSLTCMHSYNTFVTLVCRRGTAQLQRASISISVHSLPGGKPTSKALGRRKGGKRGWREGREKEG